MMRFARNSGEYGLSWLLSEDKTSSLLTGESDLIGGLKGSRFQGLVLGAVNATVGGSSGS